MTFVDAETVRNRPRFVAGQQRDVSVVGAHPRDGRQIDAVRSYDADGVAVTAPPRRRTRSAALPQRLGTRQLRNERLLSR